MLRQRLHLSLVLGASLLVGCTGSQDEYRPLTESEVSPITSPAAAEQEQNPLASDGTVAAQIASDIPAVPGPSGEDSAPEAVNDPTSEPQLEKPASISASDAKIMDAAQSAGNSKTDLGAAPDLLASTTPAEASITPLASASRREGMRGSLLSKPAAQPLEIKLLIPTKEFTQEGKTKALRVTFDDLDLLKVCNMEPVAPDVMNYLPDWLKNLNGQKIILRGWMFPSGRQEGISSFMFVRDNGICCFGRDPKVYDKLAVTMHPGKTTSYIAGRPFDVEATLLIEPDIEGPEEGMWWLYHLEDARVIDQ